MTRNEPQKNVISLTREHIRAWFAAHARRTPALVALALLFAVSNSVIFISAFEAHVINVTATIERPPTMCNALSVGYWKNHEGCSGGEGESDWTNEINVVTTEFAGIFYDINGAEICAALWIPDCPSGNNILSKRCKATAMALADELNIVSNRLDITALIADADDGNAAFGHLGLTYNSTVQQALMKVEQIIANANSTTKQLTDAAYVAERIYAFYEDENPNAPQCVMSPIELLLDAGTTHDTSSFNADLSIGSGEDNEEDDEKDDEENNNKNKKNDKNDSGNEESNSSESTAVDESGEGGGDENETATSSEELVNSAGVEGEAATTTDETIEGSESDTNASVEQDTVRGEDAEPTATSSEKELMQ